MHYLTLKDSVTLSSKHVIEPGTYMVEDVNGAQLLNHANGGLMSPLTDWKRFDETQDWNGRRILVCRSGGFGDLVRLTPVLREVKRRWPSCFISVACFELYGCVLQNLPFVDEVTHYPVAEEFGRSFDAIVFYERAIEGNPLARTMHMTEVYADIFGLKPRPNGVFSKKLPPMDDMKPEYRPTEHELIWAKEQYPRVTSMRRLCIQVGASAMCRIYPIANLEVIANGLCKKGWEIFLMGQKGEFEISSKHAGLRNLANDGLSFRQSCAVLAGADCFLGADSALLHVAGALDVPAVGLYGPFPWELRTKYTPSIHAIQGQGKCSPCFHHAHGRKQFPEHGPCFKTGKCEVLASIKPELVITRIEKIAKKWEA